MNAQELLESLNLLDENERIEAKRAQEAGKSLLETICAFANEPHLGGGWLLLGVAPDEQALFPGYAVEGVPQPDKLSADLASQCTTAFNRPLRVEIRTATLAGEPVVVVFVRLAIGPETPRPSFSPFISVTGAMLIACRKAELSCCLLFSFCWIEGSTANAFSPRTTSGETPFSAASWLR